MEREFIEKIRKRCTIISFISIKWKNFLGTGDHFTEISLNDSPNTLIIGENGAGKSTLLDALTFCLFGRSFRDIKKPQLVNTINKKACLVEVEFTTNNKQYKIIRGIKPNLFEIHCDGTCINQDSTTKDYQEHLEKFILRMNYKSFTQIVILGSASFKPFMQLSASDRRTVIEDLLDIQIFTVMNGLVKQRLVENKELLERNRVQMQAKQDNKTFVEKNIGSLKFANKQKLEELKKESETNASEIKSLEDLNASIEEEDQKTLQKASGLPMLKNKHSKLIALLAKIDGNLTRTEKDIGFYSNNDDCPTCRQAIEPLFKSKVLEERTEKAQEYKNALSELNGNAALIIKQIVAMDELLKQSSDLKNKMAANNSRIKSLKQQISENETRMEQINNADAILIANQNELVSINQDLQKLTDARQELINERLLIETAINLLKDGGVKTKIIKQYLPLINKTINKYLLQMGYLINFNIDENFNEVIKSRYRDEFSYNSFSEGQKARINLAILFAWRTVAKIKNSVNTNLLIFDEIFDGSLDSNGTDEFVKVMYGMLKDCNMIVISHKTDQLSDKFKKIIKFEMKGNFSRVVDQ